MYSKALSILVVMFILSSCITIDVDKLDEDVDYLRDRAEVYTDELEDLQGKIEDRLEEYEQELPLEDEQDWEL